MAEKVITERLIGLVNPVTKDVEAWIGEFSSEWIIITTEVDALGFKEISLDSLTRANNLKNHFGHRQFCGHDICWVMRKTPLH